MKDLPTVRPRLALGVQLTLPIGILILVASIDVPRWRFGVTRWGPRETWRTFYVGPLIVGLRGAV